MKGDANKDQIVATDTYPKPQSSVQEGEDASSQDAPAVAATKILESTVGAASSQHEDLPHDALEKANMTDEPEHLPSETVGNLAHEPEQTNSAHGSGSLDTVKTDTSADLIRETSSSGTGADVRTNLDSQPPSQGSKSASSKSSSPLQSSPLTSPDGTLSPRKIESEEANNPFGTNVVNCHVQK